LDELCCKVATTLPCAQSNNDKELCEKVVAKLLAQQMRAEQSSKSAYPSPGKD